jgi:transposase
MDHLPLYRQENIFARHGVEISRKTMGGWLAQCGNLLEVLWTSAKGVLFESKVIGTDDTGVKVLDPSLNFARTGRIWPYVGDVHHPVVLYDYTPTRGRDGPGEIPGRIHGIFAGRRVRGLRCFLQAGSGVNRGRMYDARTSVLL